jgi:hypothetical protein
MEHAPDRDAHTRTEMLRAAHQTGFPASDRLLTDWVALGFLGPPTRQGHGPGGGRGQRPGTWPPEQLQLWLQLLDARRQLARQQGMDDRRVKRIATLANLPVARWLYDGDAGGVTFAQAQKALTTWKDAHKRGSWASERAARQSARELMDMLDPDGVARPGDRRRAIAGLARQMRLQALAAASDEELQQSIRLAVGSLRPVAVRAAVAMTPAPTITQAPGTQPLEDDIVEMVRQIDAAARADEILIRYGRHLYARIRAFAAFDELDDDNFLLARSQLQVGASYTPLSARIDSACADLLTMLGLNLIAASQATKPP